MRPDYDALCRHLRDGGQLAHFQRELAADCIEALLRREAELRAALGPFAEFADRNGVIPGDTIITMGSSMGKRQITMEDCYVAMRAIGRV
jgi:hypothetical protein